MMQPSASSTRIKIEFAQASDPGRDPNKQINEDSCGYAETRFGHLCVLCDGMGGHYGGKEASRTAIATIFETIDKAPAGASPAEALKAAIEEAGRRVYLLGGAPENRGRPGSTVVAMLLHDRGLDVAHVGDSRAYIIRSNQIYPITRDHSMVQGMIDAGMLTEAQAIGHPDANKITRALGMKPEVEVEVRPEPMELFPGDVLLQSSDGLTDLALAQDILRCVQQAFASSSVAHACNQLVQLANDRGGHDNITVQMVRILEGGPKASATIPQAPAGNSTPPPRANEMFPPEMPTTPQRPAFPQETLAMTAPDSNPQPPPHAPQLSFNIPQGPHPANAPAQPAPAAGAWGPVPPTASDGGIRPTLAEQSPPHAPPVMQPQPWALPPAYPAPAPAPGPPPGLSPFGSALPLPPPRPQQAAPPSPTAVGTTPLQHAPAQVSFPAPGTFSSAPPSTSSAKGGLVYVIIGMSAVIAVLALLLIWALFLR